MEHKTNITFDPIEKSLTISGEFLPATIEAHDCLAAFVEGGIDTLEGHGEFKNTANVLSFGMTFRKREALPMEDPTPPADPSAADLDAVVTEQDIADATSPAAEALEALKPHKGRKA